MQPPSKQRMLGRLSQNNLLQNRGGNLHQNRGCTSYVLMDPYSLLSPFFLIKNSL